MSFLCLVLVLGIGLVFGDDEWLLLKRADPKETVQLTLALKQVNTEWLDDKLVAVSDPNSPQYGHHMSLNEVVRHVHADPASVQKIKEAFNLHGIQPEFTAGEGFAKVEMPASTAELMFSAQIYHYHHQSDPSLITMRTPAFTVPPAIAPYVDFTCCLNEFPRPNAIGQIRSYNTPDVYVNPTIIRSDYKIDDYKATNSSTTQGVAGFLKQYFSPNDLKRFQEKFDVPSNPIAKVIGKNTHLLAGTEASLDVEYITGTDPLAIRTIQ